MKSNHNEVRDWQKRAGVLTEDDDITDIKREEYLDSKLEEMSKMVEEIGKEVNMIPLRVVEELRLYIKWKSKSVTSYGPGLPPEGVTTRGERPRFGDGVDENTEVPNKKYGLSELSIEEKEQLKDYANAIKETKKAMMELINKSSKKIKTEDGRWGGNRYGAILDPNK